MNKCPHQTNDAKNELLLRTILDKDLSKFRLLPQKIFIN